MIVKFEKPDKMFFLAAELASDFGILNERAYRNECIKRHFQQLRDEGVTVEKAELILSEKWSDKTTKLSPESIHYILYH